MFVGMIWLTVQAISSLTTICQRGASKINISGMLLPITTDVCILVLGSLVVLKNVIIILKRDYAYSGAYKNKSVISLAILGLLELFICAKVA